MKYTSLAEAVRSVCGQQRTVSNKTPVFGGDINEAYCLTLDDGTSLFMKSNATNLLPAFEAEEAGLQAIAATGAIGTVHVLGTGTDPDGFSFGSAVFRAGLVSFFSGTAAETRSA